jgi:hypothetical protein
MVMNDSQQLLTEYARSGSEAAFAELVTNYINLVYSTAVRMLGEDAHLAKDATQIVFVNLARKAPSLSGDVQLGGCCIATPASWPPICGGVSAVVDPVKERPLQ